MAITFLTNQDEKKYIKTINGVEPDENGNIEMSSSAVYVVDYQNPNYEEAYAAYVAGNQLVMNNMKSDRVSLNSSASIYFSDYYPGTTLGTLVFPAEIRFFGLVWGYSNGYMEVYACIKSDNTVTLTAQIIRNYLNTAVGGTMKAPLTLAADPVEDLEAATKQYVDNAIENKAVLNDTKEFTLTSSTEGSTKKFKITVDDNGALSAVEIVEEVTTE